MGNKKGLLRCEVLHSWQSGQLSSCFLLLLQRLKGVNGRADAAVVGDVLPYRQLSIDLQSAVPVDQGAVLLNETVSLSL